MLTNSEIKQQLSIFPYVRLTAKVAQALLKTKKTSDSIYWPEIWNYHIPKSFKQLTLFEKEVLNCVLNYFEYCFKVESIQGICRNNSKIYILIYDQFQIIDFEERSFDKIYAELEKPYLQELESNSGNSQINKSSHSVTLETLPQSKTSPTLDEKQMIAFTVTKWLHEGIKTYLGKINCWQIINYQVQDEKVIITKTRDNWSQTEEIILPNFFFNSCKDYWNKNCKEPEQKLVTEDWSPEKPDTKYLTVIDLISEEDDEDEWEHQVPADWFTLTIFSESKPSEEEIRGLAELWTPDYYLGGWRSQENIPEEVF